MDHDLLCSGAAHDTGRRVCPGLAFQSYSPRLTLICVASFTPVFLEENQHFHSYGCV
jgi:hypothetical protein